MSQKLIPVLFASLIALASYETAEAKKPKKQEECHYVEACGKEQIQKMVKVLKSWKTRVGCDKSVPFPDRDLERYNCVYNEECGSRATRLKNRIKSRFLDESELSSPYNPLNDPRNVVYEVCEKCKDKEGDKNDSKDSNQYNVIHSLGGMSSIGTTGNGGNNAYRTNWLSIATAEAEKAKEQKDKKKKGKEKHATDELASHGNIWSLTGTHEYGRLYGIGRIDTGSGSGLEVKINMFTQHPTPLQKPQTPSVPAQPTYQPKTSLTQLSEPQTPQQRVETVTITQTPQYQELTISVEYCKYGVLLNYVTHQALPEDIRKEGLLKKQLAPTSDLTEVDPKEAASTVKWDLYCDSDASDPMKESNVRNEYEKLKTKLGASTPSTQSITVFGQTIARPEQVTISLSDDTQLVCIEPEDSGLNKLITKCNDVLGNEQTPDCQKAYEEWQAVRYDWFVCGPK